MLHTIVSTRELRPSIKRQNSKLLAICSCLLSSTRPPNDGDKTSGGQHTCRKGLHLVIFPMLGNIFCKRILRVGCTQERLNAAGTVLRSEEVRHSLSPSCQPFQYGLLSGSGRATRWPTLPEQYCADLQCRAPLVLEDIQGRCGPICQYWGGISLSGTEPASAEHFIMSAIGARSKRNRSPANLVQTFGAAMG